MFYDFDNKSNPAWGQFASVHDAAGKQWQHVLSVDTETGRMRRVIYDDCGEVKMTDDGSSILIEELTVPAPVSVQFIQ